MEQVPACPDGIFQFNYSRDAANVQPLRLGHNEPRAPICVLYELDGSNFSAGLDGSPMPGKAGSLLLCISYEVSVLVFDDMQMLGASKELRGTLRVSRRAQKQLLGTASMALTISARCIFLSIFRAVLTLLTDAFVPIRQHSVMLLWGTIAVLQAVSFRTGCNNLLHHDDPLAISTTITTVGFAGEAQVCCPCTDDESNAIANNTPVITVPAWREMPLSDVKDVID